MAEHMLATSLQSLTLWRLQLSHHHMESISSAASSAAVSCFNLVDAVRSLPAAAMAAVSTCTIPDMLHRNFIFVAPVSCSKASEVQRADNSAANYVSTSAGHGSRLSSDVMMPPGAHANYSVNDIQAGSSCSCTPLPGSKQGWSG